MRRKFALVGTVLAALTLAVAPGAHAAVNADGDPSGSAASAAPQQWAKLTIVRNGNTDGYDVYVTGHFNTTKAECGVGMRLKGDDPILDDDLGISTTGTAYYGDFSLHQNAWGPNLDEDPEGEDEIYAWVSSCTGWEVETPNVHGNY